MRPNFERAFDMSADISNKILELLRSDAQGKVVIPITTSEQDILDFTLALDTACHYVVSKITNSNHSLAGVCLSRARLALDKKEFV